MNNTDKMSELRESILILEIKQKQEGQLLKEQFKTTYENLNPVNLIKKTLAELTEKPDLKGDVLNTTLSLAAGYISKKIVVGATAGPLKQLLGTLLQVGITSIVSKNTDGIKSVLSHIVTNLFSKKEEETKKEESL